MIEKNSILLELNETSQKIKISPAGEMVAGIDGRVYKIDAKKVIENTKKNRVDIVLDKAHFSDEACGWFSLDSLEARDDGIYASLELNENGAELVSKKLFRYLSPAYEVNSRVGVKEVVRIDSVALVNKPNLVFEALNKKENKGERVEETERLKSENEALKGEITQLESKIENLLKEQKESNDKMRLGRVEEAIKRGELLPSRKETALGLNGVAFEGYLEVARSEASLTLNQKEPNLSQEDENNALDHSVARQLGLGE